MTATRIQTRLARVEAAHNAALAAQHHRHRQKLALPETATEQEVTAKFARRLILSLGRYEQEHGPLVPASRTPQPGDDLKALDEAAYFAALKARLIYDGFLPPDETKEVILC